VDLQRRSSKRSYMSIANGRERLARFFGSVLPVLPTPQRESGPRFHIGTPLLGQLSGSDRIQIDFSYIVNMFVDPRMLVKLQNQHVNRAPVNAVTRVRRCSIQIFPGTLCIPVCFNEYLESVYYYLLFYFW
jgi:hypothetical protein